MIWNLKPLRVPKFSWKTSREMLYSVHYVHSTVITNRTIKPRLFLVVFTHWFLLFLQSFLEFMGRINGIFRSSCSAWVHAISHTENISNALSNVELGKNLEKYDKTKIDTNARNANRAKLNKMINVLWIPICPSPQ